MAVCIFCNITRRSALSLWLPCSINHDTSRGEERNPARQDVTSDHKIIGRLVRRNFGLNRRKSRLARLDTRGSEVWLQLEYRVWLTARLARRLSAPKSASIEPGKARGPTGSRGINRHRPAYARLSILLLISRF